MFRGPRPVSVHTLEHAGRSSFVRGDYEIKGVFLWRINAKKRWSGPKKLTKPSAFIPKANSSAGSQGRDELDPFEDISFPTQEVWNGGNNTQMTCDLRN